MSRRHRAEKRHVHDDPKFGSPKVTKFINHLMIGGKKAVAEGIMYDALQVASDKVKRDPVELFLEALENVTPNLEVRSRRVGGATYQVPTEVRPDRKSALAMRWLISAARNRGEKTMKERLAAEFLDAISGRGSAVKKKDDTHRMAEANKAFAHFRW